MHNISSLFRREVENGGRVFKLKARIDFKDGSVLELTGKDFLTKGISLKDDTASGNSFGCGNVIAKQLDLTLNNYTGKFSDKDFENAVIWPQVGLLVKQSYQGEQVEYINLGPFTADSADVRSSSIAVTAYDYAEKLDRPYSLSKLAYPAALKDIVYQACFDCGIVPLNQNDFNNSDYVIQQSPDGEANTYRDVVSAALQIAGYNGRFDENGKFYLHWYDLTSPVWTFQYISDFAMSDTVITGVQISSEIETEQEDGNTKKEKRDFLYGTDDYALKIPSNILISGDPTAALNKLGARLTGMRFRTFTSTRLFNPALEAGDCVKLVDRLGNECTSIITSMSYSIGSKEKFSCSAQTKNANATTRFSDAAKVEAAAKKQAQNEINYYDAYAKQFSAMAAATVGYYTTTEPQDDGAVILYAHDKPKLEDSKIVWKKTGLVVAVSNNGPDGPWRGLDKDGNAILNDIAAKTIVANKVRTGQLVSEDGSLQIDLGGSAFRMNLDDGSKVVIGKDGFYNMFGESKNEYFNLFYSEDFSVASPDEDYTEIDIVLPSEFEGKKVHIIPTVNSVTAGFDRFIMSFQAVVTGYDENSRTVHVTVTSNAMKDDGSGDYMRAALIKGTVFVVA